MATTVADLMVATLKASRVGRESCRAVPAATSDTCSPLAGSCRLSGHCAAAVLYSINRVVPQLHH